MVAWLSWLFETTPGADQPAPTAHPLDPVGGKDELRALRIRRRQLINRIDSLKTYGFDSIAKEDEATLKSLDRKILGLQLKGIVAEDPADAA